MNTSHSRCRVIGYCTPVASIVRILRAAVACRQAAGHQPDGDSREGLLRRVVALGCELDPFADLRALNQDAA